MKTSTIMNFEITLAGLLALTLTAARADTFGSGPNAFTIDFRTIGNLGNADDAGAGGGIYSSPYGGVNYAFRIGTHEISEDHILKATALGLTNVTAGLWTGNQPAAGLSWFEAAAFVNFLNTSTGHQAAYQLDAGNTALTLWSSAQAWQAGGENLYRHKDAHYFLPSDDEWYKAAYHQNDGVTANYWDYPTASNAIPDGIDFVGDTVFDAVFNDGAQDAARIVTNAGLFGSYGTVGQGGNVSEWMESASAGANDSGSESRAVRGGNISGGENLVRSSSRIGISPTSAAFNIGLRVASVPEPSSWAMLAAGAGSLLGFRRRRA